MKTALFIYFALVVLTLTGCQKSGDEAVVSGMNTCIVDPASCNSSVYQQNQGYSPYGFGIGSGSTTGSAFNYYNNNAYLCNCPAGTIPTYNASAGLGCVRNTSSVAVAGLSAFFYLRWGYNSQWYNTPNIYRYNYGYNNGSSCYNAAVQSCAIGQANSCPVGYVCRPSHPTATLGLCSTSYR
ncbi:MAG: hypothetical protein ABL930_08895 [Pseudobdellovibrio sp.]